MTNPQLQNDPRLTEIKKDLVEFTSNCRADMHEPDNNGIGAFVTGIHLDNAFGTDLDNREFVVTLFNELTEEEKRFNLADLIALARF